MPPTHPINKATHNIIDHDNKQMLLLQSTCTVHVKKEFQKRLVLFALHGPFCSVCVARSILFCLRCTVHSVLFALHGPFCSVCVARSILFCLRCTVHSVLFRLIFLLSHHIATRNQRVSIFVCM